MGKKDWLLFLLNKSGWELSKFSEFKNDKDVVLAAVQNYGLSLRYASDSMKSNKDIVLKAVRQNGRALFFSSNEMKNDKEIVLEAIKNDGYAYLAIPEKLKKDKNIIQQFIHSKNAAFAVKDMKEDEKAIIGIETIETIQNNSTKMEIGNDDDFSFPPLNNDNPQQKVSANKESIKLHKVNKQKNIQNLNC